MKKQVKKATAKKGVEADMENYERQKAFEKEFSKLANTVINQFKKSGVKFKTKKEMDFNEDVMTLEEFLYCCALFEVPYYNRSFYNATKPDASEYPPALTKAIDTLRIYTHDAIGLPENGYKITPKIDNIYNYIGAEIKIILEERGIRFGANLPADFHVQFPEKKK